MLQLSAKLRFLRPVSSKVTYLRYLSMFIVSTIINQVLNSAWEEGFIGITFTQRFFCTFSLDLETKPYNKIGQ